jgi:energy-coupling factor transport system substrate-specific component
MTQRPLPLSGRSGLAIGATSLVGVLAFFWPIIAPSGSRLLAYASNAPILFGLLVPLFLAVSLGLVGDGAMGAKAVALLGVLAATAAGLRALGGGIAGLEPIWVVIVLGGYALGSGFGFDFLRNANWGRWPVAAFPDDRSSLGRIGGRDARPSDPPAL